LLLARNVELQHRLFLLTSTKETLVFFTHFNGMGDAEACVLGPPVCTSLAEWGALRPRIETRGF
jgi:hypothetical protein